MFASKFIDMEATLAEIAAERDRKLEQLNNLRAHLERRFEDEREKQSPLGGEKFVDIKCQTDSGRGQVVRLTMFGTCYVSFAVDTWGRFSVASNLDVVNEMSGGMGYDDLWVPDNWSTPGATLTRPKTLDGNVIGTPLDRFLERFVEVVAEEVGKLRRATIGSKASPRRGG